MKTGRWVFGLSFLLNGRPAVYFHNTSAFRLPVFGTNWTQGEVFVVLKTLPPVTNQLSGLWLFGVNPHPSRYPNTDGNIYENFGRKQYYLNTGVASVTLTNAHLYNVMSKGSAWTNRFNNVDRFGTTDNVVGFNVTPWLGWGANYAYFRGYISEIMVFNRELTAEERERGTVATNYLRARFSLW